MHLWHYIVLASGFLLIAVTVRWVRGMKSHSVEDVLKKVGDRKVLLLETFATSFGIESEGPDRARGPGCLVGTTHEVLFVMWKTHQELHIQRAVIAKAEAVEEQVGKTAKRKLLKITYRNAAGQQDSCEWWVTDLKGWLALLSPQKPSPASPSPS